MAMALAMRLTAPGLAAGLALAAGFALLAAGLALATALALDAGLATGLARAVVLGLAAGLAVYFTGLAAGFFAVLVLAATITGLVSLSPGGGVL